MAAITMDDYKRKCSGDEDPTEMALGLVAGIQNPLFRGATLAAHKLRKLTKG